MNATTQDGTHKDPDATIKKKKKKYTSSVVYEKWSGLRRLNFGAHKASGQYERVANLCEVEVRGRM